LGPSFYRCFVRFCFYFDWIRVQVFIDASVDFVFVCLDLGSNFDRCFV